MAVSVEVSPSQITVLPEMFGVGNGNIVRFRVTMESQPAVLVNVCW